MSGKKKSGSGSFLSEFSFVLAVVLLVAALGGIFFFHRMRSIQEEEKLEQIIANEKSPQITGAKVLSEQIALSEDETSQEFEAAGEGAEAEAEAGVVETPAEETSQLVQVASNGDNWAAAMPVGSQGDAEGTAGAKQEAADGQMTETNVGAQASGSDPADLDVKKASVLIINGTYKNGVASYWEGKLKEAGFTDLSKASYSGKAEQLTAIYGVDKEKAEAFKEFFPTAEFRDGNVPAGYTMADDSLPRDVCDFYIVVGLADAINS